MSIFRGFWPFSRKSEWVRSLRTPPPPGGRTPQFKTPGRGCRPSPEVCSLPDAVSSTARHDVRHLLRDRQRGARPRDVPGSRLRPPCLAVPPLLYSGLSTVLENEFCFHSHPWSYPAAYPVSTFLFPASSRPETETHRHQPATGRRGPDRVLRNPQPTLAPFAFERPPFRCSRIREVRAARGGPISSMGRVAAFNVCIWPRAAQKPKGTASQ